MLLGCLLPLALIFVLPVLGVGSGMTLLVFVVLMFGCHLMMMGRRGHGSHGSGGHGGHSHHQDKESDDDPAGIHQHPQH
jgi:hypothetical protein